MKIPAKGRKPVLGEKEVNSGVGTAFINLFHAVEIVCRTGSDRWHRGTAKRSFSHTQQLHSPCLNRYSKNSRETGYLMELLPAFDILIRVKEREKAMAVLNFIYLIDVYIAVAKVATTRGFVFPVVHPRASNILKVLGVYHPELKEPVPNDLSMHAGKSVVFTRRRIWQGSPPFCVPFSTAVYIAHMGFPVAAQHLSFRLWMVFIPPSTCRII